MSKPKNKWEGANDIFSDPKEVIKAFDDYTAKMEADDTKTPETEAALAKLKQYSDDILALVLSKAQSGELEGFLKGLEAPVAIQLRADDLDFKAIHSKALELTKIPIDEGIIPEMFHGKGYKKTSDEVMGDGRLVTYKQDKGHRKITIQSYLPLEDEDGNTPELYLAKNNFQTYKYIVANAVVQKTFDPIFKKADLARFLGADKNPGLYKRLRDFLRFLVLANFEIEDKGKKTWEIGHLADHAKEFDGKYWVQLNSEAHKALTARFNGVKDGQTFPRHTKHTLQASGRKDAISELLLRFKNSKTQSTHTYMIKTLLRRIGLTDTEINTKSMLFLAIELDDKLKRALGAWTPIPDKEQLQALWERRAEYEEYFEAFTCFENLAKMFRLTEAKGEGIPIKKADFLKLKVRFVKSGCEHFYNWRREKLKKEKDWKAKNFYKPEGLTKAPKDDDDQASLKRLKELFRDSNE